MQVVRQETKDSFTQYILLLLYTVKGLSTQSIWISEVSQYSIANKVIWRHLHNYLE